MDFPISHFHKRNDRTRIGVRSACRACCAKKTKSWAHRNPDKVLAYRRRYRSKNPRRMRDLDLRREYGMTIDDYEQIADMQHNACAICRSTTQKLHVDHCHSSGRIRGLLCGPCNRTLGLVHNKPEVLDVAAVYLRARA